MPLKAFVKNLTDVDEAHRTFYREVDGGHILDITSTNGYALENVDGLKTTLGKFKTRAETAETTLATFRNDDGELLDITALKAAAKKGTELEGKVPEVKTAVEAALAEAQTLFDQKYTTLEGIVEKRTSQLQRVLVDDQATKALVTHKGNIRLLLPHVRSQVQTKEVDGEFREFIVDAEGNPRLTLKDGKTADMTIEDLVLEMSESEDFLAAFDGTGESGSGNQGDHGDRPRQTPGYVSRENLHSGNFDLEKVASGETQLRD